MTQREQEQVKKLIAQGKSMKEIIKIMNNEKIPDVFDDLFKGFKKK